MDVKIKSLSFSIKSFYSCYISLFNIFRFQVTICYTPPLPHMRLTYLSLNKYHYHIYSLMKLIQMRDDNYLCTFLLFSFHSECFLKRSPAKIFARKITMNANDMHAKSPTFPFSLYRNQLTLSFATFLEKPTITLFFHAFTYNCVSVPVRMNELFLVSRWEEKYFLISFLVIRRMAKTPKEGKIRTVGRLGNGIDKEISYILGIIHLFYFTVA